MKPNHNSTYLSKQPKVPTPDALKNMAWSKGVWTTYQSLQAADPAAASNYLTLQWRLDFDSAYNRDVKLTAERSTREKREAIMIALPVILHPYQEPLTIDNVDFELERYGVPWVSRFALSQCLNSLIDQGLVRKFQNPFGTRKPVFCHEMFRAEPAVGDQVAELIRRKSQRTGIVEKFRYYRMNSRIYPVVRWDATPKRAAFSSFANPDMLIVVAKAEPFAQKSA